MKSHQPLISIALCTYNGERFLREQLDSLVNQTYQNLEIIAIDDCSTDNTLLILKEYENKFDFLNVYQNPNNLGFRKNFEKAISQCNGEFIALCDQDDIWRVDKLEIQCKLINENVLVYHDSELIDENGKALNKKVSDVMNLYQGNQCHTFLFENCVSGHSCLFSKKLIPYILPFPTQIYHDKWIAFVAASQGNISFSKEVLVYYRQHSNSNTDLLRKKKQKGEDGRTKIEKSLEEIKIFKTLLPHDPFIQKIHNLFTNRVNQFLSLELFLVIFKNRAVLYYCKKKSSISVFGYCLKYLWGYRLKK